MLKISKLMKTSINTQMTSSFGVITKDYHTKESEVNKLIS
jgi:hypothetical protein